MTKHAFIFQIAVGVISAFMIALIISSVTFADEAGDAGVDRLSDKQVRQILTWMESDSREIGRQARELEERSRALREEMEFRIASNHTGSAGGSEEATQGLAVTLSFKDGEQLNFSQDQAKCFEDWVGSNFTQRNCRASNGFWHVSFRPDTTSDRVEVVVELGHVTSDMSAPFTAGEYTFRLSQNGKEIASQKVPFHFWGGRWRWQSEERPILKTCDDIKDHPFLPQLEKARLGHDPGKKPVYSGPFTMPEFERGMGNGGERHDIGVVTGWSASCLLGGAMDEENLIALAADYSAVPVHHFRLPSGEMIDITKPAYQNHNFHWNTRGNPNHIAMGGADRKAYPSFVSHDTAHHPSLFFIPFLLTEDPFWLEELQYSTLRHILASNFERTSNDAGQRLAIFKGQMRGFAWGYRDILHAHYLTPDDAPNWLLPKSYYDKLLADILIELNAIMNDSGSDTKAIQRQRFNIMWSNSGWLTVMWMQDFNVSVWGLGVRAGYEQFRPWFEWLLVSMNERTKDNGWDRRVPSFYNVDNRKMDFGRAQNWSELFPIYKATYPDRFKTPIDKWPEDSYWETRDQYSGYADYVYGGLVVAEWLGYDMAGLDYLEEARNGKQKRGARKTYDKWSFKR